MLHPKRNVKITVDMKLVVHMLKKEIMLDGKWKYSIKGRIHDIIMVYIIGFTTSCTYLFMLNPIIGNTILTLIHCVHNSIII